MPLVLPGVLGPAFCRSCREAMDRGVPEEAEVLGRGFESHPAVRQTSYVEVAPDVLAMVEAVLDSTREAVAAHFGRRLRGREGPGFLRYGPGGFYRPHRDRADADGAWPEAARRQVAVVAFLNSAVAADPREGGFEGGILRLLPDGPFTDVVDVVPRAGTVVAFPAERLHEVTPVLSGTRDAVVDWFY